jgi:predicted transcriptional regulator
VVRGLDATSTFTVRLAHALREVMAEHKVQQKPLQEALGKSQAWVSEHTSGRRAVDSEMIAAVAELTKQDPADLLRDLVDRIT